MIGLVIIFIIGLCLLIFMTVVGLAVWWAKRHGRRGWVWGWVAALAMYNLLFWDLIPSVLMHRYYCFKDAGFWVYKAPEQWVKENPGVLETLSLGHLPEQYRVTDTGMLKCKGSRPDKNDKYFLLPDGTCLLARYSSRDELMMVDFETPDGPYGYQFNERIRWSMQKDESLPIINRNIEEIIDVGTGVTLARYVGVSWGSGWTIYNGGGEKWNGGFGTLFLGGQRCPCDKQNQQSLWDFMHNFRSKTDGK